MLRGATMLAAAAVPPLCCTSAEAPEKSLRWEPGRLVVNLRQAGALKSAGGSVRARNDSLKRDLLLIRVSETEFAAMNTACTHGGAPVVYNGRRKTGQCTSLGHSEFALHTGEVIRGPAPKPIQAYKTRLEGDLLIVELEGSFS